MEEWVVWTYWACFWKGQSVRRASIRVRVKERARAQPTLFMAPTKQASVRQSITLKGSTELVTEFFKYAVNTYVSTTTVAASQANVFYLFTEYCFNVGYTQRMTFIWSRNMAKPC